jgi:uncharacterized membrane protein
MLPATPPSPPADHASTERLVELSRLHGLSDGVFAFALTLLVLDIRVSEESLAGELPARLLGLAPRLLVYLVSFVVIGGAWAAHQRMLGQIQRGDGLLVWFNLLSLLFVTLLPASAALLGRFHQIPLAIAVFAADVVLIQLTSLWLWRHAGKHGLIDPSLDPRVVQGIGRRLLFSAFVFAISAPLALRSAAIAYVLWIGIFLLLFTTDWLSWRDISATREDSIPLQGASRARIRIQHAAGHLQLGSNAEHGILLSGRFGGGLVLRTERSDQAIQANLQPLGRRGILSFRFPWSWGPANALDWELSLNPQVELELELETAGGTATVDLSSLQAIHTRFETSASAVTITLPSRPGLSVLDLQAGVASVTLVVPPEVAAYLHATKSLSSLDLDPARFETVTVGREYRSPGYETAARQADVKLDVAVGSVEVT